MTLKTLIPQDMSKAVLLIVLKVFKGLNFPCSNWICLQFFAWQKQRNLKTIVITHRYFDHHHDSLYQPLSWKNPDQQDDYPDPDLDQWPGLEKGSSSQSSGKCSCWQPEEKNSSEHCQIQGGESPRTGHQIDHDSQKPLEDDNKDCWNSLEMKASKSSWSKKIHQDLRFMHQGLKFQMIIVINGDDH